MSNNSFIFFTRNYVFHVNAKKVEVFIPFVSLIVASRVRKYA